MSCPYVKVNVSDPNHLQQRSPAALGVLGDFFKTPLSQLPHDASARVLLSDVPPGMLLKQPIAQEAPNVASVAASPRPPAQEIRVMVSRGVSRGSRDTSRTHSDLWASARSPLWRRRGPGSGSARADSDVRWRTLGRARARGVMMAARGRGRVEGRARGLRYAGVGGFETPRSLAWTLAVRVRNGGQSGPT